MPSNPELPELLRRMDPVIRDGVFVCVSVPPGQAGRLPAQACVTEPEGMSVVLRREDAAAAGLAWDLDLGWISLRVESSLAAVGLTAAFASALAAAGISANVLAGFHHDHLLVPLPQTELALQVLRDLADAQESGPA